MKKDGYILIYNEYKLMKKIEATIQKNKLSNESDAITGI